MAPDELVGHAVSSRLEACSPWGYDALAGRDLAFVVAAGHRNELTPIPVDRPRA